MTSGAAPPYGKGNDSEKVVFRRLIMDGDGFITRAESSCSANGRKVDIARRHDDFRPASTLTIAARSVPRNCPRLNLVGRAGSQSAFGPVSPNSRRLP